jgi:DUF2075 family protein
LKIPIREARRALARTENIETAHSRSKQATSLGFLKRQKKLPRKNQSVRMKIVENSAMQQRASLPKQSYYLRNFLNYPFLNPNVMT